MAKNMRLPEALHIELPVPANTVSGDLVAVGAWRGVAQTDRDADGNATVWINGSTEQTVSGAVATKGLPIYIVGTGASLKADSATATATGNTLVGYSLGTKAAADGPLEIGLLNGPAQV
jgi:predicted RecA/RadA family phage recombinase